MLTLLQIRDETTASIGKTEHVLPEHVFTVAVAGEEITVGELIRARIEQEVAEYNQRQPQVFHMLVLPGEAERTLNGYQMARRRVKPIDAQAQYQKALEAFEGNGFIVLVDDRQVEGLEEKIALRPETAVAFLKLTPLVGG